jgi:hypothetical protein
MSRREPVHVLFVCTQNRLRSPTAEHVFADWPGVETQSAGLGNEAGNPVSPELLTIASGGRMPRRVVVAELHDGTRELLGPEGVLTWADHWAQQAATWMGLPFKRGNG